MPRDRKTKSDFSFGQTTSNLDSVEGLSTSNIEVLEQVNKAVVDFTSNLNTYNMQFMYSSPTPDEALGAIRDIYTQLDNLVGNLGGLDLKNLSGRQIEPLRSGTEKLARPIISFTQNISLALKPIYQDRLGVRVFDHAIMPPFTIVCNVLNAIVDGSASLSFNKENFNSSISFAHELLNSLANNATSASISQIETFISHTLAKSGESGLTYHLDLDSILNEVKDLQLQTDSLSSIFLLQELVLNAIKYNYPEDPAIEVRIELNESNTAVRVRILGGQPMSDERYEQVVAGLASEQGVGADSRSTMTSSGNGLVNFAKQGTKIQINNNVPMADTRPAVEAVVEFPFAVAES